MSRMPVSFIIALGALGAAGSVALAQAVGTAFTYQGELNSGSGPVNGTADFQFSLWDADAGGAQLGVTQAINSVSVAEGLFTVALNGSEEFGAGAFGGSARWLGIAVRSPAGSGSFVTLSPRQELTPTPLALALPGLRTEQTDDGSRAPTSPNVIGGDTCNNVTAGVVGATVAGGGTCPASPNRVTDDYGTVGGGANNRAGDNSGATNVRTYATVGGGIGNVASGIRATIAGGDTNTANGQRAAIGGGFSNDASANYSTIPGGYDNTAGGVYSVAAGRRAKVRTSAQVGGGDTDGDQGTFVWGDSTDADFLSTGPNQFLVRAAGGVGIGTNAPFSRLHVFGDQSALTLQDDENPTSYTQLIDSAAIQLQINKYAASGAPLIDINPIPLTTDQDAKVRLFRSTNTTGNKSLNLYKGDGTNTVSALIGVNGTDSYFQMQGGNVGIGTTTPDEKLCVNGDIAIPWGSALRTTDTAHDGRTILQIGWSATPGDYVQLYAPGAGLPNLIPQLTLSERKGVIVDPNGTNAGNLAADTLGLRFGTDGSGEGIASKRTTTGNQFGLDFYTNFVNRMAITNGGNVGVGTTSPTAKLHSSTTSGHAIRAASSGSGLSNASLRVENPNAAGIGIWCDVNSSDASVVIGNSTGDLIRGFNGGCCPIFRVANDGTTSVSVLEITGADLAEKFPVSDKVEPGMVVEIDPDNPGKLKLARGAYNRRVAGVVSGAGDLPAGAILGNLPGHEDAPPIALTGRVWVHCDASNGAIEPGDLLTTSDTPGNAMKVTDYPRAQGAIIGKAMISLGLGERGLVLVLVNLQ